MAALLAKPLLPVALLLLGVGVGMAIGHFLTQLGRGTSGRIGRPGWSWKVQAKKTPWEPRSAPAPARPFDAADQLRIVMGARFTMHPLLNRSEARVLRELERFVEDRNPSWQVMAQVSVGEIVRSADSNAFACINSKRIDLLLIDGDCLPRHAIEYQGLGHHQGSAAARDAVKKEALRRAGIGYHEVVAGQTTPSDLQRLVEKLVTTPPSMLA